MPELVIVRHALAFDRDSTRWPDDRLRPLSPQGKKKFRQAASGLARWYPHVDLLLTSPLVRALQTAKILADVAGWPKAAERGELDPATDPQTTLASLRQPRVSRLALVGHEPHLSNLIALCVAKPTSTVCIEMKKGAAAVIRFDGPLRVGHGTLIALVPARVLRRMG
jgi:phosphohistidine phosphatase